jgi:hypothetical protein
MIVRRVALADVPIEPVVERPQEGVEIENGRAKSCQLICCHFQLGLRAMCSNDGCDRSQDTQLHSFDVNFNKVRRRESIGANQSPRVYGLVCRCLVRCVKARAGVAVDIDPPQLLFLTLPDDRTKGLGLVRQTVCPYVSHQYAESLAASLDCKNFSASSQFLSYRNSEGSYVCANIDKGIVSVHMFQEHRQFIARYGRRSRRAVE